jgi:hypothetical protein
VKRRLLNKLIENLIFAMNFDDKVPEHIIEEIMSYRKNKNKSDSIVSGGDALTNTFHVIEPEIKIQIETEPEPNYETDCEAEADYGTITEFNAEVDKKIKGIQFQDGEAFFSAIVGYSDIKKLLTKCIQSSDPMHIIFDGPPASAKSMFLLQMQKKLDDTYYVDCTNASGPGMVEYLFKNDVKYLLLDEVEKMSESDQNVLLNVLETGILTSTKVKKTGSKKMDISVYATTNDIDAISKPFRSRFVELSLPGYNFDEFCEIAVKLTGQRDVHDRETAMKIADTVWNKLNSSDVRDIIQISRLAKSIDDVEFLANTLQKYKRKKECEGRMSDNGNNC